MGLYLVWAFTVLHMCLLRHGQLRCMKLLLQRGARLASDRDGVSPLQLCVQVAHTNTHTHTHTHTRMHTHTHTHARTHTHTHAHTHTCTHTHTHTHTHTEMETCVCTPSLICKDPPPPLLTMDRYLTPCQGDWFTCILEGYRLHVHVHLPVHVHVPIDTHE